MPASSPAVFSRTPLDHSWRPRPRKSLASRVKSRLRLDTSPLTKAEPASSIIISRSYLARWDRAAERRRFLDGAICQLRPRYAQALAEYGRLYDHKTRILRDWPERPSLLDTLDDFNLRMAQTGAIVVHYRAHFIKRLRERAPAIHREFSGGREELTVSYRTVKTVSDPFGDHKLLVLQLLEHQREHHYAEISSRQCLSGPHKDEIEVQLDGISARSYASQGQTRTAALSLKLAAREIHKEIIGEYPILLLDDVLSELDPKRQEYVLNRLGSGQVFITCCEEDRLHSLLKGNVYRVSDGVISSP